MLWFSCGGSCCHDLWRGAASARGTPIFGALRHELGGKCPMIDLGPVQNSLNYISYTLRDELRYNQNLPYTLRNELRCNQNLPCLCDCQKRHTYAGGLAGRRQATHLIRRNHVNRHKCSRSVLVDTSRNSIRVRQFILTQRRHPFWLHPCITDVCRCPAIRDDDCAQDAPSSVASVETAAGQRCSSSARMQTGQVESRHMSSRRRCLSVRLVSSALSIDLWRFSTTVCPHGT